MSSIYIEMTSPCFTSTPVPPVGPNFQTSLPNLEPNWSCWRGFPGGIPSMRPVPVLGAIWLQPTRNTRSSRAARRPPSSFAEDRTSVRTLLLPMQPIFSGFFSVARRFWEIPVPFRNFLGLQDLSRGWNSYVLHRQELRYSGDHWAKK